MNDSVFYQGATWLCHGEVYNPGWYFWDETWADCFGPYATEWQARGQLRAYCMICLGE